MAPTEHVSDGKHVDLDRKERTLKVLVQCSAKFQRQLTEALQEGETGWHRLNIKIEGGQIMQAHLQKDEHFPLD